MEALAETKHDATPAALESDSLGLLILTPIVICWLFDISLSWAVTIGLAIIVCFALFGAMGHEGSILRSKLPKRLQRIRPEHVHDVQIVVFGTAVGFIIVQLPEKRPFFGTR